ncbi:hypothetical protein [Escherichia coli]|uniref:hypothetical protein n=2 Tax=Bacteria TaxID=2 RepID=UPI001F284346|nr:hypothetical protein [Escherichia coli]
MEEYYSIKDVANICNKNKSSVSRKLTNLCFEIMNDDFDMHFKKQKGYNNIEQFFFNEYAVKYIISLFYKDLDYNIIKDMPLNQVLKKINTTKINTKLSNIEILIDLVSNPNSDTIDILNTISNIKSDFNKLNDEINLLKSLENEHKKDLAHMDFWIDKQNEEIDFLKNEILKRLKKD